MQRNAVQLIINRCTLYMYTVSGVISQNTSCNNNNVQMYLYAYSTENKNINGGTKLLTFKETTIMLISFYRNLPRNLAQTHSRPAPQDIREWSQFLTNEGVSTRSKYLLVFFLFYVVHL